MRYALIAALCFVLIGLLLLADLCFTEEPEPVEPPERDWGGLKAQQMVAEAEPSAEPEYEMYFSEDDIIAVAKMLWGEARGCDLENQIGCVWIVCNRVDDPRFPDTITGVVAQPSQFHGYSPDFPVWDELKEVALDVLTRWSLEKQGVTVERELPPEYVFFTGDGIQNNFREVY